MQTRNENPGVGERIGTLLNGQPFAVLCTQGEGQPYGSVIAYAFSLDLAAAAFATPRDTTKYRLLGKCDRVAVVVDSRSEFSGQVDSVEAITATGRAVELTGGPEFERWARALAERHPQLRSFFRDAGSAVFRIDIERYTFVTRFQEVQRWSPLAAR